MNKSEIRELGSIISDVNGIWRGYTVEVSGPFIPSERASAWNIRLVLWEGDEKKDYATIQDIREFDAAHVEKRTRPRAGFKFGDYRIDPQLVREALAERDRRIAEIERENT